MRIVLFTLALIVAPAAFGQGAPADSVAAADTSAIYIPTDLDDALTRLDSLLGPDQAEQVRSMDSEDEFSASAHFGLEMWLRNNWGLWGGSRLAAYFNEIGVYHPDDMSGIILDSYYRRLHGQPIRLEEQVAYYQAYWEEARQRQEAEDDGGQ